MSSELLESVCGPVAVSELRWVLPHEHLLAFMDEYKGESVAKYPGQVEYVRRHLEPMLAELPGHGVNGLVDPLPMGIGRDQAYVEFARGISESSGVHVFLATGLYGSANWPQWAHEWSAGRIADLFSREFEHGIGDTGVRPCIIKAAVWNEFTAECEKALTAAALAQRKTGASLHVHATGCRREIVELLTGLDVPGSRIYIAHADMNTSEEEYLWLAQRDVRLVMTNWDFPFHMDQDEARRLVKLLIDKGHIDKVLLSIDFYFSVVDRWTVGIGTWDNPDRTSYAYLLTHVLPKLRTSGIADVHLQTIMRDNPLQMLRRA